MLTNLAFPVSIMIIKLVLKVTVEQEVRAVDCLKAMLAFPIDIAFLSLSFGSAILLVALSNSPFSISGKKLVIFIVAILVLSIFVTVVCKKSDKAFNKDDNRGTVIWASLGYLVALLVLFASAEIGGIL